jgi:hypothetical protein
MLQHILQAVPFVVLERTLEFRQHGVSNRLRSVVALQLVIQCGAGD